MGDISKEELITVITSYLDVFPQTRLNDNGVKIYARVLAQQKISPERLERAMDFLITKCKYFPTIAEIVEHVHPKETAHIKWVN